MEDGGRGECLRLFLLLSATLQPRKRSVGFLELFCCFYNLYKIYECQSEKGYFRAIE